MVAVRGSHLLNPKDFVIENWCADLGLSPEVENLLVRAWRYSQTKAQQLFLNSHWYLRDGVEMVEILHSLNMDGDTLLAAMLFPVVNAKIVNAEQIKEDFGNRISKLVKGVIDMNYIRQLDALQSSDSLQIDNIRRMLLAMVDDFRCVIIKLAERITYLRDADKRYSREEKIAAAKECTKVYAPLANRLGIGQLKWELEDYCFRNLQPEQYRIIALKLNERRLDREQYIQDFVQELSGYLRENISKVEIYGRPKHIYSIWRKMQKKIWISAVCTTSAPSAYWCRIWKIVIPRWGSCTRISNIYRTNLTITLPIRNRTVINPSTPSYWVKATNRSKCRFARKKCTPMPNSGLPLTGNTKKAPRVPCPLTKRKSLGCASCWRGRRISPTAAALWAKCVPKSSTIGFMYSRRKAKWWICRQVPPRWISLTPFTVT